LPRSTPVEARSLVITELADGEPTHPLDRRADITQPAARTVAIHA
jgi:hypothetical protein